MTADKKLKKIVPDTSIIIDRKLSELIEHGKLKDVDIIVPAAVLDELQAQASRGREHGFIGLEELKKLRALADEKGLRLRFTGKRPSLEDIQLAKSGRMDAVIRDIAKQEDAEFITADYVQALVGEAEGIKVRHIPAEIKTSGLTFEKYFDDSTISVHLKQDVKPLAKRGKPGEFKLVEVGDKPLDAEDVEAVISEIGEAIRGTDDGSVEISRRGAMVVQLGSYRIAIARPPFADGLEVTIIRPIIKMKLEDYKLSEKLMQRLTERAEGVLIAGPPGSGKSTLAAGLAEFYMQKGNIVKTLESPRDLQVGPEITQYAPLEGDYEKTADLLLLVRPDYSVFDEIRKPKDFGVFADLRMAGVGMIGVVHASKPIDAIQRFMGKVELGVIPHVIDTIVFVRAGRIEKVYELSLSVRVPTGMTEADLARPVVDVKDFETGRLEYEIYTFGEETIVIPVDAVGGKKADTAASGARRLAADKIRETMRKFDPNAEVEVVSDTRAKVRVDNAAIARIIGKAGSNVERLQDMLGMHLDIEPRIASLGQEIPYDLRESGGSIELKFKGQHVGHEASVHVDDQFLFSAIIGKKGKIKVTKKSDLGRELVSALVSHKRIRVMV
ncbi:MAG: PINc/VapC family ATPase [Candidatus Aenigmatarchaeota archaeon]